MTVEILDQYHGDATYAQLQVLTRNAPAAREMLKTASFDKVAAEQLPSTAFAWEDRRRFPVHTMHDAIASIFYRTKVSSFVPVEVDRKLATAAKIYGLTIPDFDQVKQASTEVTYALPEHKRLPLDTPEQVKLAEEVLCRDHQKLNMETRADAFSRLVKAAAHHDVAVSPLAYKFAGLTTCDNQQLRDWLEARAEASVDLLHKTAFQTLASGLKKAGVEITERKDLVKLAGAINVLDQQAGLTKYYDRKLPDPLQTVFNTEKLAEDTCDVGGKKVACSRLMGLPDSVWDQVDVPELAKLAEDGNAIEFKMAFETLPLDIKMVLRSYV